MQPSLAFVLPVHNEEGAIHSTLGRIRNAIPPNLRALSQIVVVDDGSTDSTPEILDKMGGITVLTHDSNAGYGAALKTGLDYVSSDWVAIVDADGTYPIESFPELLDAATKGKDMVVGARRGLGISRDPFKRVARWCLRRLVFALTGVSVPDLNSGMRVFRRSLYLEFKHLLPTGFSFTTTLTVASLYCGYRVQYLPVEYFARKGKSHIKAHRDFINFLMLIVRMASYFDPLRFFIPLSIAIAAIGVLKGIRDIFLLDYIGSLSVMMILSALQVLLTGILADVIVRRMAGNHAKVRMNEQRRFSLPSRPTLQMLAQDS